VAAGAIPTRTLTVTPKSQYVAALVRIHGKHWVVSASCSNPVKVTVKKPSGAVLTARSAAIRTDGSFGLSWRIPKLLGGMTLRIRAVESCLGPVGGRRVFQSAVSLHVMPTP
jgi:hypothetical protein